MQGPLFTKEENFSFWKNFILIIVFLTITPVTLGISLFSLYSLQGNKVARTDMETTKNLIISPQSGVRVFASLPIEAPKVTDFISVSDARPRIIEKYLKKYNSPLLPHSDLIVQTADKYQLDFRLITAIAQQESNLCKIIPPGGYNCWGWGITGSSTLGFDSFEHGIEIVSEGLRRLYLNRGYKTVDEIMSKYTPMSNGSWALGVNQFMENMQ